MRNIQQQNGEFTNRMHMKDALSGHEDKVEDLNHLVQTNDVFMNVQMEHAKYLGHPEKTKQIIDIKGKGFYAQTENTTN